MHDPSSYSGMGWLLAGLAALALAANAIMNLIDRFKDKPPASELYVPYSNCMLLHKGVEGRLVQVECEVRAIREEAKKDRETILATNETRSVALHNRLNEIQQVGAGAAATSNLTNQRICQLDEKTDKNFRMVVEMIERKSK